MSHNVDMLRAIFEYLHKNSPQPVASQCLRCQAVLSGMMPPNSEVVQVITCPNCHSIGAVFGSHLVPLSAEIMKSNDSEAKRQHIIAVIMKVLHGQLLPLITEIVGVETESCSECGQPRPVGTMSHDMEHSHPAEPAPSHEEQQIKQSGTTKKTFSVEDAQRISDAYITLGLKVKQNPGDEMLHQQFKRQEALYNTVKHLLDK